MTCLSTTQGRVGESPGRTAKDGKNWVSREEKDRQTTRGNRQDEGLEAGTCRSITEMSPLCAIRRKAESKALKGQLRRQLVRRAQAGELYCFSDRKGLYRGLHSVLGEKSKQGSGE